MEKDKRDLLEDEFRVLGTGSPVPGLDPEGDRRIRRLGGFVALAIVALLGLGMILFWPESGEPDEVEGVFESLSEADSIGLLDTLSIPSPCVVRVDTLVSGHPVRLFIPHRATPRLLAGNLGDDDRKAVMTFQAADIRADNQEILGDFVEAGKQLASGSSKRGFCAIVDGKVTVGVSEHTPLLAEAVSRNGYFFRQYPLVDKGLPVSNKPQNKTLRKALCDWNGQVFVAVSEEKLTLDEFAKLLADLGVSNAIYLVGSSFAYGWSVDKDGNREEFGSEDLRPFYRNQSYILWE